MISIRRKILFYFFILIFLILVPSIIMYANGYKLDLRHPLSSKILQKTGMLIIKTKPENAIIYINDKKQEDVFSKFIFKTKDITTPAKIKGLLPGEYDIELTAPNYWSWNKKITITSGQISHATDVKLFKKEEAKKILNTEEQNIRISNNRKIIYLEKDNLIFNLKNEETTKTKEKENFPILWSPDNNKIITKNFIIHVKDAKQTINIKETIGENLKNKKWDTKNSNKLYYQYKNSLNCFDFSTKENKTLIENKVISDFLIKNGQKIIITREKIKSKLAIYPKNETVQAKEIELPYSENYKLINPNHRLINLYDEKYQILYLINPQYLRNPLEEIVNNIKYSHWIDDDTLLYANDFEIWTLDLKNNQKYLITRLSDKIKSITKIKKTNHIIYSTEKSINILERGENQKIQITKLIELDKIINPILNQAEDIIYFYGETNNEKGLYKLSI